MTSEIVDETTRGLAELRALLAPQVAPLVGGRASPMLDVARLPAGVSVLDGLGQFRALGHATSGSPART